VIVHDYVSGLADAGRLLDMINESREGQDAGTSHGALLYSEVWYTSRRLLIRD
jgi:exosome complex exonuclease DIS3/RRP44